MPDTLIFVPGIGGSQLLDPAHPLYFLGHGEVWLCPPTLLAGGWRSMRLAVPDEPPPSGWRHVLIPGGPIPAYYGGLLNLMRGQDFRTVTVPQDWRQPIVLDAAAVAAAVVAESGKGPVYMLCHSRGGLVIRKALQLLESQGKAGLVKRVVSLGTPHTGALSAVSALFGRHRVMRWISEIQSALPSIVGDFLGIDSIYAVVRSFPSVYELLPALGAPWLSMDPPNSLYVPALYDSSPLRPVAAYVNSAATFWANIPPAPPSAVDWVSVAGTGTDTAVDCPHPAAAVHGDFVRSTAGDGTVAVASARLAGTRTIFAPTSHDFLPLDVRLVPYITAALRGGLAADVVVPGGVLGLN